MDYGKIISQAINITLKNRYLWWLSLLTIIGGVASDSQGMPSANFSSSSADSFLSNIDTSNNLDNIYDQALLYIPLIIIIVLIFIIIAIVLFIIGLIAKGGLIEGINQADNNQKNSFFSLLNLGKKFAWKIFLSRLLFGLASIAIGIISIPIILVLFLFFWITIPLLFIVYAALGVISNNTQTLLVLENQGVINSIKRSWEVTKKNWDSFLILALIQFGLGISVVIIFLLLGFFVILFFIAIIFLLGVIGSKFIIFAISISISIFAITVFLIICSILNTFFVSFWTIGLKNILIKKTAISKPI